MPKNQRNNSGWSYNNPERSQGISRVTGAGKRATQNKNQTYAKPLPPALDAASKPTAQSSSATSLFESILQALSFGYYQSQTDTNAARALQAQDDVVIACLDRTTNLVWIADTNEGVRLLWQRGFFGKGNLSRSEPTWKQRKVGEIDAMRKGLLTAEQLTQQRREERKALKIERARAAVRAGQQLPDGIVALGGEILEQDRMAGAGHERLMADIERQVEEQLQLEEGDPKDQPTSEPKLWTGEEDVPDIVPGQARIKGLKYFSEEVKANAAKNAEDLAARNKEQIQMDEDAEIVVEDRERMQLSLVETFFLAGMLGCLEVREETVHGKLLSIEELYTFLLQSPLPSVAQTLKERDMSEESLATLVARPDNPFLINYVAYHHFRSIGWVVKTGLKFCCDYLLYKRGPVFSHAEFAVVVVPSYEDPEDEKTSPFPAHPNAGSKSWVWFSTLNRVNTQVLKTLILAHVFVPSRARMPVDALRTPQAFVENLKAGRSYAVKEVAVRRWVPARMKA